MTDSVDSLEVAVSKMTTAVGGLSEQLDEVKRQREEQAGDLRDLATYGRKNRTFIRLLAFTVCFDLIMSATLGFAVYKAFNASNQARHATSLAQRNHQVAIAQCVSGNDYRTSTKELWTYVLRLSGATRPQTPEEQANSANFRVYLDKISELRDCSKVTQ